MTLFRFTVVSFVTILLLTGTACFAAEGYVSNSELVERIKQLNQTNERLQKMVEMLNERIEELEQRIDSVEQNASMDSDEEEEESSSDGKSIDEQIADCRKAISILETRLETTEQEKKTFKNSENSAIEGLKNDSARKLGSYSRYGGNRGYGSDDAGRKNYRSDASAAQRKLDNRRKLMNSKLLGYDKKIRQLQTKLSHNQTRLTELQQQKSQQGQQ